MLSQAAAEVEWLNSSIRTMVEIGKRVWRRVEARTGSHEAFLTPPFSKEWPSTCDSPSVINLLHSTALTRPSAAASQARPSDHSLSSRCQCRRRRVHTLFASRGALTSPARPARVSWQSLRHRHAQNRPNNAELTIKDHDPGKTLPTATFRLIAP